MTKTVHDGRNLLHLVDDDGFCARGVAERLHAFGEDPRRARQIQQQTSIEKVERAGSAPARACIQAGLVKPEFLVEIAATAVIDG